MNNFENSSTLLRTLMENNPRFRSFVEETELCPQAAGQKLSALLIMPIQRMYVTLSRTCVATPFE